MEPEDLARDLGGVLSWWNELKGSRAANWHRAEVECRGTAFAVPLAAAGCQAPAAYGSYVVAADAGAAGKRGARRLRRDAVRHREWRAERIGALCHRVAVRASATESGAEEDEAGCL